MTNATENENGTTTGRVWLITGATSGFGRAIAEAALAAGDTVVAAARRPQALDDLAGRYPGRVNAVALDVTDQSRIAEVADDAEIDHADQRRRQVGHRHRDGDGEDAAVGDFEGAAGWLSHLRGVQRRGFRREAADLYGGRGTAS